MQASITISSHRSDGVDRFLAFNLRVYICVHAFIRSSAPTKQNKMEQKIRREGISGIFLTEFIMSSGGVGGDVVKVRERTAEFVVFMAIYTRNFAFQR